MLFIGSEKTLDFQAMPVSIRKYTELKLAVSDYLQRRNWIRLFEVCGTGDDETAKTIAVIFTFYDEREVWKFLKYVHDLDLETRREKRDSVATACFIVGKMGQSDVKKSLDYLRRFLSDDHMLQSPVTQALSNFWVISPRKTGRIILDSWISANNDDLQKVGVMSSEYLGERAPNEVSGFLLKVSTLDGKKVAARAARELLETVKIRGRSVRKKGK